jgi:hypothetical protein
MATYENGYEEKEESAQMTEDDLAYKDKYEDHQSVLNLLSSCQEADHDNREMSREAHLFLDKTGWSVGAVLVGSQPEQATLHL